MNRNYHYNEEFNKNVVMETLSNIDEKIQEITDNETDSTQDDKVRELLYAKFIAGLKLSTGSLHF